MTAVLLLVTSAVLGVAAIGVALMAWVWRRGLAPPSWPAQPCVAVVLGARVFGDGSPGDVLRARVETGLALLRDGRATALLFSGGSHAGLPAEAEVARRLALAAGAPASALDVESDSRNTFENAREVAALLAPARGREVLLVTSDTHLLRATAHFRAHGFRVFPVASRTRLSRGARLRALGHEAAALLRRPWLWWGSVRWPR